MSDPGDELQRKRDLLREELARIERQLAQQDEGAHAPPFSFPESAASRNEPEETPESILAQYHREPSAISRSTKLGCIAYFAVAMLALLAIAGIAYLSYARSLGR